MRTLVTLALVALTSPALADDVCYDLEEVAVLDADGVPYAGVSWWSVNNRDVFAGDYCLDADCTEVRGALYDATTGHVSTFEIPGYTANVDSPRINDRGQIVGSAWSAEGDFTGWVRSADGTITLLDHLPGFVPQDINNRGDIAGFFAGPWPYWTGAVVSGKGWTEVEEYVLDDAPGTALWAIDDAGGVSPSWEGYDNLFGYIQGVDRGHGVEWLDWADAGASFIAGTVWSMNNRGQLAGALLDGDTWDHPGFVRTGDSWQLISYEGRWTAVLGINDHGVLAGTFDGYDRGMVGWPVDCD